ncbi:hypothetical protein THRCLA_22838 [Thraustotheca clavata]|uniref:Uncharacterized protein n=1 Tax=Thraustotheca clavata TaxID=74557 RepID=A0A1V9YS88_9STRA|nr:hypothetical protein THRCLA_22838 [Thraustotheca clavata]
MPKELLTIPEVANAITNEATTLLERLRHSIDPGQQWKVKTKRFLRQVHAEHHKQRRNALQASKIRFLQAKWKFKHGQLSPADLDQAQKQFDAT